MSGTFDIRVEGMGCQGCVSAVEKAISAIDAGASVNVDLKAGIVHVGDAAITPEQASAAIKAAGYDIAV